MKNARRHFAVIRASLLVISLTFCPALPLAEGRATPNRVRSAQDELDKIFDLNVELCPGKEWSRRFPYPADYVGREITSDDAAKSAKDAIATARFRSDLGELTIKAGANEGSAPKVMTITLKLSFGRLPLGATRRGRDQAIYSGTYTHTIRIKVTVLPRTHPKCSPPPERTPTGTPRVPAARPDGVPVESIKMCIGDTTIRKQSVDAKNRRIEGLTLKNENPAVASASLYVEKKDGLQTSAPAIIFISALSVGTTKITISDGGFLTPQQVGDGVQPYEIIYLVLVKKCDGRTATGPGADKVPPEGVGRATLPKDYVPVAGRKVTLVPPPAEAKGKEKASEETKQDKPSPSSGEMRTLGQRAARSVGLVVAANSRLGERAVVSVVLDPERFEAVPGLRVVKQEVELPVGTTPTSTLERILVDTGEGRTSRADEPIELRIDGNVAKITLRSSDDQSPLARFDLPVGETIPLSNAGLDLSHYQSPPIATSGGVHVINGQFSGDLIRDNVMIDGRPGSALLVAKSTRSLFYRVSEEVTAGSHRVNLRENSGTVDLPLCVLKLSLSADQLELRKGQTTKFRAVINGPETLPASAWERAGVSGELFNSSEMIAVAPAFRVPASNESGLILFVLENKSPEMITIGKEVVVLKLGQQDFKNGPYKYEGMIRARNDGRFKIDGTVKAFLAPVSNAPSTVRRQPASPRL